MAAVSDVVQPVQDLTAFPRVDLCHQPTPIEPMLRLSEHFGGPAFYVKRDDCTGLAGGGNKTRKLEFLVGDALQQNADMLVTHGAVQSNHVRQTAAAACRFGLKCHALLEQRVTGAEAAYAQSGNVFLDYLLGATLEYRPSGLDMNAETMAVCETLRQAGHRPYFIPGGGSNEIGALGYVACAAEIAQQAAAQQLSFDWLVTATGSTGTHAGLVAGLHWQQCPLPVMGISVRQPQTAQIKAVQGLADKTVAKLAAPALPAGAVMVDDGYVGDGYGIPAPSTFEALTLAAQLEGLLLDPVYSAKGFAGLIGLTRAGFFKAGEKILFLHTGGAQALFAYAEAISANLPRHAEYPA